MAKADAIPGLDPEVPYATAAARVVAVRGRELIAHSEGVLELDDIEPLHDMRVATRRLRAALEVFAPCFPKKRHRAVLREVKGLADALGERRDRDVMIAQLEGIRDALTAADRPGLESLIERVRKEQAGANEALAPVVAEPRLIALQRRIIELVEKAEEVAAEAPRPEGQLDATRLATGASRNGGGPQ